MDAIVGALKSKTMWVAAAVAVLPFIAQPVQDFITAHPGPAGLLAGVLMATLRAFTTQSLPEKAVASKGP